MVQAFGYLKQALSQTDAAPGNKEQVNTVRAITLATRQLTQLNTAAAQGRSQLHAAASAQRNGQVQRSVSPSAITEGKTQNALNVVPTRDRVHVSPQSTVSTDGADSVDATAFSASNILVAGAKQAIETAKLVANAERRAAIEGITVTSQKYFNDLPWRG